MMLAESTSLRGRSLLYIILMVTVGLTFWTAMSSDDVEEQAIVAPRKNVVQAKQIKEDESQLNPDGVGRQEIATLMFRRASQDRPMKDLFRVHSWTPPASIKKVVLKPGKAAVPAVPFTYSGKLEGTPQGTIVFLIENNQLYTTAIGENVNSRWRLDGETTDSLHFTYLPMNLLNVLSKSTSPTVGFRPFAGLANSRND